MKLPPRRIDVLTRAAGLVAADAWRHRAGRAIEVAATEVSAAEPVERVTSPGVGEDA
jgi:hypothetical protein